MHTSRPPSASPGRPTLQPVSAWRPARAAFIVGRFVQKPVSNQPKSPHQETQSINLRTVSRSTAKGTPASWGHHSNTEAPFRRGVPTRNLQCSFDKLKHTHTNMKYVCGVKVQVIADKSKNKCQGITRDTFGVMINGGHGGDLVVGKAPALWVPFSSSMFGARVCSLKAARLSPAAPLPTGSLLLLLTC